MSENLSDLIARCIDMKTGDKEFILHFEPYQKPQWRAEIGNRSNAMHLGETAGEFEAEGSTAEEAVSNLIEAIRQDIMAED